jgi:T-complex protein 1 subunit alpha
MPQRPVFLFGSLATQNNNKKHENKSKKQATRFVTDRLAIPVSELGPDTLAAVARTSMASKVIGSDPDHFARLVVDAVLAVKQPGLIPGAPPRYPIKGVAILKAPGGSMADSRLIRGVALNMGKAAAGMPTRVSPARVACVDFNLQKARLHLGVQVLVSDPAELAAIRAREADIARERVRAILDAGANVVLTTKGIDDLCLKYFVEAGAVAVRRVPKDDLRRVARATGATLVTSLADEEGGEGFDAACLGSADEVVEECIAGDDVLVVRGGGGGSGGGAGGEAAAAGANGGDGAAAPAAGDGAAPASADSAAPSPGPTPSGGATILLRGANDFLLDEMERAVHDALCAVRRVLESGSVVPGGGAAEAAVSVALEGLAATLGSREQLAIAEFADAVLAVPKALAVNAARDAADAVAKLRAHHYAAQAGGGGIAGVGADGDAAVSASTPPSSSKGAAGRARIGLDLSDPGARPGAGPSAGVRDNVAAGVLEPAAAKVAILRFATEAAITILRIDDLIRVEAAPDEED